MDDLISRQAAIDRIEEHLRFGDELYPLTETDKILNHAFEIAASCVYNLPSAQPEPRWIPVTERLPIPNEKEEDEVQRYYLIQNEFKDMMVAAYRGNNSGYTWWEQMYAYKPIEDKVVAWMPLPEPYRKETEDE